MKHLCSTCTAVGVIIFALVGCLPEQNKPVVIQVSGKQEEISLELARKVNSHSITVFLPSTAPEVTYFTEGKFSIPSNLDTIFLDESGQEICLVKVTQGQDLRYTFRVTTDIPIDIRLKQGFFSLTYGEVEFSVPQEMIREKKGEG